MNEQQLLEVLQKLKAHFPEVYKGLEMHIQEVAKLVGEIDHPKDPPPHP